MDAQHEIIELDSSSEDDFFDPKDFAPKPIPDDQYVPRATLADPQAEHIAQATAAEQNLPNSVKAPSQVVSFEYCLKEIMEVFPDISHDHVRQLYAKHNNDLVQGFADGKEFSLSLIEQILDVGKYPKEKDRLREIKELKRKREDRKSPEEEAAKWKPDGLKTNSPVYHQISKLILQDSFPMVPVRYIGERLKNTGHYYATHLVLAKAERDYDEAEPKPYALLKSRRHNINGEPEDLMRRMSLQGQELDNLKQEIEAARQRQIKDDRTNERRKIAKAAADAEDEEYRLKGEVMECACCFDDAPVSKITHCNGNETHFFCFDCARRNADNDIGLNKYDLLCMDGSSCKATFSRAERHKFLDQMTVEKLENLEQETSLRLAMDDLEDFVACPFCHYGHICPPIGVDREFRCGYPECREVSCRLCKEKSHLPKSCEEHRKENGLSERHAIEEARTEALVRTCPKCKVRILKEDGCNKVTCTTCFSVLCDFCGKDISTIKYEHFEGQGRVPVAPPEGSGKCPLYDLSADRKNQQIEDAGKFVMGNIRRENPDLSEEDLKIKFSKEVEATEQITERTEGRQHLPHHNRHRFAFMPHPEALRILPDNQIQPPIRNGMNAAVPGYDAALGQARDAGRQYRVAQLQQHRIHVLQQERQHRIYQQQQLRQQLDLQLQQANLQAQVDQGRANMQAVHEQNAARLAALPNQPLRAPNRNQRGEGGDGSPHLDPWLNDTQDAAPAVNQGNNGWVPPPGLFHPRVLAPQRGHHDHHHHQHRGMNDPQDRLILDQQLLGHLSEAERRFNDFGR